MDDHKMIVGFSELQLGKRGTAATCTCLPFCVLAQPPSALLTPMVGGGEGGLRPPETESPPSEASQGN